MIPNVFGSVWKNWQASKASQASKLTATPQGFPLLLSKRAELCEDTASVKMLQSRNKTSTTARCHFQYFLHIVFSLLAKRARSIDAIVDLFVWRCLGPESVQSIVLHTAAAVDTAVE